MVTVQPVILVAALEVLEGPLLETIDFEEDEVFVRALQMAFWAGLPKEDLAEKYCLNANTPTHWERGFSLPKPEVRNSIMLFIAGQLRKRAEAA